MKMYVYCTTLYIIVLHTNNSTAHSQTDDDPCAKTKRCNICIGFAT